MAEKAPSRVTKFMNELFTLNQNERGLSQKLPHLESWGIVGFNERSGNIKKQNNNKCFGNRSDTDHELPIETQSYDHRSCVQKETHSANLDARNDQET